MLKVAGFLLVWAFLGMWLGLGNFFEILQHTGPPPRLGHCFLAAFFIVAACFLLGPLILFFF